MQDNFKEVAEKLAHSCWEQIQRRGLCLLQEGLGWEFKRSQPVTVVDSGKHTQCLIIPADMLVSNTDAVPLHERRRGDWELRQGTREHAAPEVGGGEAWWPERTQGRVPRGLGGCGWADTRYGTFWEQGWEEAAREGFPEGRNQALSLESGWDLAIQRLQYGFYPVENGEWAAFWPGWVVGVRGEKNLMNLCFDWTGRGAEKL